MAIFYDEPENFKNEDEFIDCFNRGCELCFDYGGKSYSAAPDGEGGFDILEAYKGETRVRYPRRPARPPHRR